MTADLLAIAAVLFLPMLMLGYLCVEEALIRREYRMLTTGRYELGKHVRARHASTPLSRHKRRIRIRDTSSSPRLPVLQRDERRRG